MSDTASPSLVLKMKPRLFLGNGAPSRVTVPETVVAGMSTLSESGALPTTIPVLILAAELLTTPAPGVVAVQYRS